jgi:hypothetical protein
MYIKIPLSHLIKSIKLNLRPRQFHWMIEARSWRRIASVGTLSIDLVYENLYVSPCFQWWLIHRKIPCVFMIWLRSFNGIVEVLNLIWLIWLLVQALLPVVFFIFKKLIWKSYTITLKIDYVYSTYVDEDERAAVNFFIIYSDYLHLLC